jgi:RNA polymerase sigma-70 factor (ECF subfamily)
VYNLHVESALSDDGAMVAAALRGDAASFGALVERYQQPAFRAAYLLLRDAPAAEDVAQEAFVRAYRQLKSFRPERSPERSAPFRPWLLRIVQNLALNELRARSRRGGLVERMGRAAPSVEEAPAAAVEAAEESAAVLRAMEELPPDDRVVLHLRYFLELPEREIAAAIGRPAGTVKSRLHRASARLRQIIETKYPGLVTSPPGPRDAGVGVERRGGGAEEGRAER